MFSDDDIRAYAAAKAKAEKEEEVARLTRLAEIEAARDEIRRITEKTIWEEINVQQPVYKQRKPGEDRPKIIGLEAIFDIGKEEDND